MICGRIYLPSVLMHTPLCFVVCQGATSFIDNEVTEGFDSGGRGAALFSASQVEEPMVFSGGVTVSGNSGSVRSFEMFYLKWQIRHLVSADVIVVFFCFPCPLEYIPLSPVVDPTAPHVKPRRCRSTRKKVKAEHVVFASSVARTTVSVMNWSLHHVLPQDEVEAFLGLTVPPPTEPPSPPPPQLNPTTATACHPHNRARTQR